MVAMPNALRRDAADAKEDALVPQSAPTHRQKKHRDRSKKTRLAQTANTKPKTVTAGRFESQFVLRLLEQRWRKRSSVRGERCARQRSSLSVGWTAGAANSTNRAGSSSWPPRMSTVRVFSLFCCCSSLVTKRRRADKQNRMVLERERLVSQVKVTEEGAFRRFIGLLTN